MALVIGVGAGFGAVFFRWLIYAFTWLATGHQQFGQQGRVASLHLPWLGIWFFLLIPVVGGLLYGPLIHRFAPEARGHGVPEVMIAVAEGGGRIRPQVSVVKALASAICIGVGGSVGREGPIVQIGSALASSLGQLVHMSESRLRILVACGAAGGISATFNAPITGVFFGFELILREFSIDALFAIILSSVMADLIGQAFFGSAAIFSQMPHGLLIGHDANYLLVALLGIIAAFIGVGFKTVLYKTEDVCDSLWKSRPEWLRPAVGGLILGAVLLALPEMYGVGYPVMTKAVAGDYVLWFLVILMLGKMVTASLTIGIGGSGGVFAPSLFTGATAGTAFGVLAQHVFGPSVGPPAMYGVIAMGAVFAAAAQAPLTSIASVLEMTGNFGLALPVMLAVGISAGVSKRLTHGTIYTTKLLRRGTDIERPKPSSMLQVLTVAEVMQPLATIDGEAGSPSPSEDDRTNDRRPTAQWPNGLGEVVDRGQPQVLFGDETLEQALRQLVLYGLHAGLPVITHDQHRVIGWVTYHDVLRSMADRTAASQSDVAAGSLAADWARPNAQAHLHVPSAPLEGYDLVEIRISGDLVSQGHRIDEIELPAGGIAVAATSGRKTVVARSDAELHPGDMLLCLIPIPSKSTADGDEGPESTDPNADGI
ncbi:MAG TPA: chloride channel protein [Candidatus Micrarchaeaceae archaeon]|nr:chloride channel protein [Candidatus Micrarchaeaceae archaeon]